MRPGGTTRAPAMPAPPLSSPRNAPRSARRFLALRRFSRDVEAEGRAIESAPDAAETVPPSGSEAATSRTTPEGLHYVQIFYGTNRRRLPECLQTTTVATNDAGSCRPGAFYADVPARVAPGRPDELEVGTFTVTLPPGHVPGEVERPFAVFSFDLRREDPQQDVVISELSSSGNDYAAWVRAVRATGKDQAFIYVHGYHTTFAEAARRAGQLAVDMNLDVDFHGLPMLYSWPSRGTTAGYVLDYDTSLDAIDAFNRFLDLVKEQANVAHVHVIAHSMGNQLVATALHERALAGRRERFLDQLVLAAPDVWADRFRERFLTILPQLARRVTLYVSDNDRALQASTELRDGNPRAGLLRGGLIKDKAPGFDVVDATGLPAEFLDHSYYANNDSMRADIYCLLKGSPAEGRPLIEAEGVNWRFRSRHDLATLRADDCRGADAPVVGGAGEMQNAPAPVPPPAAWLPAGSWRTVAALVVIAIGVLVLAARRRR